MAGPSGPAISRYQPSPVQVGWDGVARRSRPQWPRPYSCESATTSAVPMLMPATRCGSGDDHWTSRSPAINSGTRSGEPMSLYGVNAVARHCTNGPSHCRIGRSHIDRNGASPVSLRPVPPRQFVAIEAVLDATYSPDERGCLEPICAARRGQQTTSMRRPSSFHSGVVGKRVSTRPEIRRAVQSMPEASTRCRISTPGSLHSRTLAVTPGIRCSINARRSAWPSGEPGLLLSGASADDRSP
jgi:hypothetical protein